MRHRENQRAVALVITPGKLGNACRVDRQNLIDAIEEQAQKKSFVGTLLLVTRKVQVVGL